jgi:hypothetical protein
LEKRDECAKKYKRKNQERKYQAWKGKENKEKRYKRRQKNIKEVCKKKNEATYGRRYEDKLMKYKEPDNSK